LNGQTLDHDASSAMRVRSDALEKSDEIVNVGDQVGQDDQIEGTIETCRGDHPAFDSSWLTLRILPIVLSGVAALISLVGDVSGHRRVDARVCSRIPRWPAEWRPRHRQGER
jgi:hypothetical protein